MIRYEFDESVVEEAALAWLESLGWTVRQGRDLGPGGLTPFSVPGAMRV